MCDSANPYYAPTAGQNMSFGNGPSTRSDIEDDIGHNVTWRTDDDFDKRIDVKAVDHTVQIDVGFGLKCATGDQGDPFVQHVIDED